MMELHSICEKYPDLEYIFRSRDDGTLEITIRKVTPDGKAQYQMIVEPPTRDEIVMMQLHGNSAKVQKEYDKYIRERNR